MKPNDQNLKMGFTLLEIMIVVAIVGLLAVVAIPSYIKPRANSQKNVCINNLRLLDGAKQQWALDTNQAGTATPVAGDLDPYVKRDINLFACPTDMDQTFGTSYTINDLETDPACKLDPITHMF